MKNEDKMMLATVLAILLFLAGLVFLDYKKDELKLKQPKYLIEIKNEMYELKKIDRRWKNERFIHRYRNLFRG